MSDPTARTPRQIVERAVAQYEEQGALHTVGIWMTTRQWRDLLSPPNALLPTEGREKVRQAIALAIWGDTASDVYFARADGTRYSLAGDAADAAMRALAKPDEGVVANQCQLQARMQVNIKSAMVRLAKRAAEVGTNPPNWDELALEASRAALASLSDNDEGVGG